MSFRKECQFGQHTLTLETGKIARQATGAVMASWGDTMILATVVEKPSDEPKDFFPLTVNYQERTYAAGKIPGGYFKREGRPTEKETLTSRLIDRPIRPLFPKGFSSEVQVIITVMSVDPHISPDILGIISASAALAVSGIPFDTPVAAARVGYADGDYLLNPSDTQLKTSELDLVVAGTKDAVLMVESEASGLSEEIMLGAVLHGHQEMQTVIDTINALASEAGITPREWTAPAVDETLANEVANCAQAELAQAYQIADKMERQERIAAIRTETLEKLCPDEEDVERHKAIGELFSKLEKATVRDRVIAGNPRIDGRDTKTVRPISIETRMLPRVHGSALFTRGETQAIAGLTLGTMRDAQILDELVEKKEDPFMLHYNFPPYCVGEVGFMSVPKRREIGHGMLAKRAIRAVLPNTDDFPYTIRAVSEITESNGSSSMATVCGTSLALMDAGVPIKAAVAGIAMGLIKEGDQFVVLSDILGDEDHLGDMDFKVAGTSEGITALQMDIKINGITKEIMEIALEQAKAGRLHILEKMNATLAQSRDEMSPYAPRITSFKVNPDKIRDIIGKGGATIRELTEQTGTTIDIDDDGTVKIAAVEQAASDEAKAMIDAIVTDVQAGDLYEGKVDKIVDFGAFISFGHKKSGLLHISQIKEERVEDVRDELSEGDTLKVRVLEVDRQGRVRLSTKPKDLEETAEKKS